MFGALDQDWHPEEECRPPNAAFLEAALRQRQGDGAQHAALPRQDSRSALFRSRRPARPHRLARHALHGIPRAARRARSCASVFRDVGRAHGHHPSIAIWTLFNEGWGIDLDDNPDDRRWLIETFDWAKTLVPDSLLVDNSPCFPRNYHLKTDIEDFHWYNGFPHQNDAFAATTRAFAEPRGLDLLAAWRRGAARRRAADLLGVRRLGAASSARDPGGGRKRALVVRKRARLEPRRRLSAWDRNALSRRAACADLRRPRRLRERGAGASVSRAQAQIETLRWERAISGYVITELNDVQWEFNGLMDVQNHPRAFAERLAEPSTALARSSRRRRARPFARASALKFPCGSPAPPSRRRARDLCGASAIKAARPRLEPIRRRLRSPPAPPRRSPSFRSSSRRATARGASCRATRSNSASSRRSRRGAVAVPHRWRGLEPARRDRLAEPRRERRAKPRFSSRRG